MINDFAAHIQFSSYSLIHQVFLLDKYNEFWVQCGNVKKQSNKNSYVNITVNSICYSIILKNPPLNFKSFTCIRGPKPFGMGIRVLHFDIYYAKQGCTDNYMGYFLNQKRNVTKYCGHLPSWFLSFYTNKPTLALTKSFPGIFEFHCFLEIIPSKISDDIQNNILHGYVQLEFSKAKMVKSYKNLALVQFYEGSWNKQEYQQAVKMLAIGRY